jgi:hypothetical protein
VDDKTPGVSVVLLIVTEHTGLGRIVFAARCEIFRVWERVRAVHLGNTISLFFVTGVVCLTSLLVVCVLFPVVDSRPVKTTRAGQQEHFKFSPFDR